MPPGPTSPSPPATTREPRTKGERTRQRLKRAAREALDAAGYPALRVADITAAAGVSQGTFYLYFANKREVTLEVMRDFLAEGQARMRGSGYDADPFASVLAATRAYVAVIEEHQGLARALLQLADEDAEFADMWQRASFDWLQRVAADIDRRCGRGAGDERTRMLAAYAVNWMVDGFLHSLLLRNDAYMERALGDLGDIAEALSVLWFRALYGRDPDPARLRSEQAKALTRLRLPAASAGNTA